jgi:S-adenosylmethionine synthetase
VTPLSRSHADEKGLNAIDSSRAKRVLIEAYRFLARSLAASQLHKNLELQIVYTIGLHSSNTS